jgi:hypothetical protein
MPKKLNDFFTGVYAKYLSAVDADPQKSHQHEIGSNGMKAVLGTPDLGAKKNFRGDFLYISGDGEETISAQASLTWYDTRHMQKNRSPEYRLYYGNNPVSTEMSEGDFIIIAKKRNEDSLLVVVTPPEGIIETQLRYLFNIDEDRLRSPNTPFIKEIADSEQVSFVEGLILETLGITPDEPDPDFLETLLRTFGNDFPATRVFSQFARDSFKSGSKDYDWSGNTPDEIFISWFKREAILFSTLEGHILSDKLSEGFRNPDDFVAFSLSFHNRRKSRAGHAAENHLKALFKMFNVKFSRGKVTEGSSKPDFIFPGIEYYHDHGFPKELLSMLGSKTTCKDRWRQVLAEANKIPRKHLFTLQPGISVPQTEEMKRNSLQLVVPSEIRRTYTTAQSENILTLSEFVDMVVEKQKKLDF